ncbi:DUF302 domain-containing protein [Bacteroidota bacterium]
MKYYFSKSLTIGFDETILRVKEELINEGFGVLTDIDVQQILKNKIGVNFKKYRILGACNPQFAYLALQRESRIGTMLPCNVIVQEMEDGSIDVAAVDPVASMKAIRNPELQDVANEVREKLRKVIEKL